MLGHPYDNYETMVKTLNFAKALDFDYPHFFKALPFPGTKMYDMIVEHGHFIKSAETEPSIDGYTINAINFEIWHLKNRDVKRAFNLSYKWFYLRPTKILKLICQFRTIHDISWALTEFIMIIVKNLF